IQGRLSVAMQTFSEMLRLTREHADRDPNDFFWKVELARAVAGVGDLQFALGQTREAAAAFDENLTLNKAICEINGSPAFQRDLVGAQARVADLLVAGGRYSAAQDIFLQSLDLVKRLSEQDPMNAGLLRDVGVVLGRVTDGYAVQSRRTDAMAAARKYLGIFELLTSR